MIQQFVVDQSDARRLTDAALVEAGRIGRPLSIAICDRAGHTVSLLRMDRAGLLTSKVATDKARTAAFLRAPSSALAERVKENPALLRLDDYLPMAGGLPIMVDGQCIGAIGISGGSDEEDVAVATAALRAFED